MSTWTDQFVPSGLGNCVAMDLRSSVGSVGANPASTASRGNRQRLGQQFGGGLSRRVFATMRRKSVRGRIL